MHWTLSSIFIGLDAIDQTIAMFSAFLGVYVLLSAVVLSKLRQHLWSYLAIWAVYPFLGLWAAMFLGRDIFDMFNLLGMAVFIGGVGLFSVSAYFAYPLYKKFATIFAVFAVTLAVVGIDAFVLEPGWLEVRHEKVVSNKLHKPIRIAVMSDMQTDHVTGFERNVFKQIMDSKPDMVLLPGDYIQAYSDDYANQVNKFRTLLRELKVSAPLGVFATEGDAERPEWAAMFKDLPITTFQSSSTIVIPGKLHKTQPEQLQVATHSTEGVSPASTGGPMASAGVRSISSNTVPCLETARNASASDDISLTSLTLKDSWRLHYKIPASDKFHIVVGHRPDYMLNAEEGDLFIAGHTHGGQVQLPFYGPILTFSTAPRKWCGGCCVTQEDGRSYVITRGVGMERERAPRLRFFCRPEIVIIDVVPAESE